jgi:HAD superfamily hydrolase (TIGR01549 family)
VSIEAVIFDLDNTLCQYEISTFEVLKQALEQLGREAVWHENPQIFNEAHWAESLDALWRESDKKIQSGNAEPRFIYGANLANALHLLGQAGVEDEAFLDEVQRVCLEITQRHLIFCPNAPEVVRTLSQNYKLGLITNGPTELQWGKVDYLNVRDWFGAIVVSHDIGILKPDPRIFETALNQLGVSASQSVYVGDSVKHDIQGAHNAGLKSVWVNSAGLPFDENVSKPDLEIDNLDQLLEWLKGLNPLD